MRAASSIRFSHPGRLPVCASICLLAGAAAAQATTESAAPAVREPPPISYNSGASGEFRVDPSRITLEILPDGARLYHLNGQGMEAMGVRIGADGRLEFRCTDWSEALGQSPWSATLPSEDAARNIHER